MITGRQLDTLDRKNINHRAIIVGLLDGLNALLTWVCGSWKR